MPPSTLARASMALRNALRASGVFPIVPRPVPGASRFQFRYKSSGRNKTSSNGAQKKKPEQQQSEGVYEKDDQPFHFQMWDSSALRVQREKERQKKMLTGFINHSPPWQIYASFPFLFMGFAYIGYKAGLMAPWNPDEYSTTKIEDVIEWQFPHAIDAGRRNLEAAWADFRDIVGERHVSQLRPDLEAHSDSAWSSYTADSEDIPFCVLRPKTTEEVQMIVKVCHDRRIPMYPYSGGTSLEGQYAITKGGVCIDFGRMNKILALHEDDLDVVVQPGVGWERLNEVLATKNLFFPPDPGPGAQIGGMIGTRCSGTNAYRYGTMKDWVLNLTVVLPDGTVIKTGQRARKSSAGYDLTRLFVGSEGTLGFVTEATLKVTVKPQSTSVAVCAFKSIRDAANCVFRVVKAGVPIAAIEILDDVQMKCINDAGTTSKRWKEAPTLFFKFAGTPNSVKEQIEQVQTMAKASGSKTFEFAKNEEEQEELWSARKEALWSVMAKAKPDDKVWTTDVAVPISKLPDIIEETKEDIKKSGLMGSIVGHVGDGNFHSILLYNKDQKDVAEGVVHRMVNRAIELEGTCTGEHGVGLVKRDYLNDELGQEAVDLMRKIKLSIDPLTVCNHGKVLRTALPSKPGEIPMIPNARLGNTPHRMSRFF